MSYVDLIDETICALITAPGISGIAVLRVSGPKSLFYVRDLCPFLPESPESHRVYFGRFLSSSGEMLDEVLVTYFAKGKSFTGDETLEISSHGGFTASNRILSELALKGCRPAERGEFSFRSFYNGKMDLVQAEGIYSLIHSRSEQSRSQAVGQLTGQLSRKFHVLEQDLISVLAQLEASIDFSTEDIEPHSLGEIKNSISHVLQKTKELCESYERGKLVREGIRILLAGPPNAGKSSIYNRLLGENKAIVTDVEGTTRDLLETSYTEFGSPIQLMDSAGLRDSEDTVEKIGIQKTLTALNDADAIFYTLDISKYRSVDLSLLKPFREKLYFILNKMDLSDSSLNTQTLVLEYLKEKMGSQMDTRAFMVSALKDEGFESLRLCLKNLSLVDIQKDEILITQYRHYNGLKSCSDHLLKAMELCDREESFDLIALETQTALRDLYGVLGKEFDEQVLDQVFRQFCIGK